MFSRILVSFIVSLGVFLPSVSASVQLEDTAWSMKRVLKLDETIRSGSGRSIIEKKRRWELLAGVSKNINTIYTTWNLIPTTDKTLEYTLTLQKYKLSCEIAAMKAVFWALGYPRSEDYIIRTLPHHNKPMNQESGIWWDPDKEFVWLYQGSQNDKTGYGIYEWAIARYFHTQLGKREKALTTEAWNELTRPEEFTDTTHLTYLLTSLDSGKHVILWGDWCTAPEYEDGILWRDKNLLKIVFPIPGKNICKNYKWYRYYNWKTQDGKDVVALSWDHVFVLLGYIGKADTPTHIIVWDTDTGRHVYPTVEWMRKWWMMQNRSLIVNK